MYMSRDGARVAILASATTGNNSSTGGALESHRGGQGLRWAALRRALDAHVPTATGAFGCDRWYWGRCKEVCHVTGAPAAGWNGSYYTRAQCDDYADELVDELTRRGVSTVVCSGLDAAPYVPTLVGTGRFLVVFDMHNVELPLQRAIAAVAPTHLKCTAMYDDEHVRRVGALEGAAVGAAHEVWTCSSEDRAAVIASYPGTAAERIRVVPNVVDVPDTAPGPAAVERICFTGTFGYWPNIEAGELLAGRIAPDLVRLGHQVPVVIAGTSVDNVTAAHGVEPAPTVRLVSNPDSTDDLIAGSIMAVPLLIGGGTRFKILQAFAAGSPVVSTPKGAEGIAAVPGEHYLVAEPDGFAGTVDRLLRDADLRQHLVDNAYRLVRERYSIDALSRHLESFAAAVPAAPAVGPATVSGPVTVSR